GVGLKTVGGRDRPWWLDVDRYRVLNSHADQVMDLPPGGRALGGNDHCEVSLMALGDDIVGIQGHPEFQPAYVRALIERRRGRVIPDDVCDAAEESLGSAPDNRLLAEGLVRFLTGGCPATGRSKPLASLHALGLEGSLDKDRNDSPPQRSRHK